ncbi:glycosyltransferase family 4 protein [Verrucomicrobiota bacterium]
MRIGVNTLFLLPGKVGGSETYVRELLGVMAGMEGVELVLFTNRDNDSSLRDLLRERERVEFCPLNFSARSKVARVVREQTQLPRKVARAGIDLLWSPGYTVPRFCSVPQVVTIHDMQYETHPEVASRISRKLRSILVPMAAERCERVLTVSEFARDEIVKYLGTARDKIDVTPEAADRSFALPFGKDRVRARNKRMLGADAPYILCVSNTYPHKKADRLVEAFGRLADPVSHFLVLVGFEGRGEAAVVRAIAGLGTGGRVVRLQGLGKEDLSCLYQGAGLFVFPSVYEGFGLPVLEAMVAGVPVLTTRCGAIPEVGGPNVNYFNHEREGDLQEKITQMLALDEEQRERIVSAARARAAGFTWERTAEGTLACFRRALRSEATGSW